MVKIWSRAALPATSPSPAAPATDWLLAAPLLAATLVIGLNPYPPVMDLPNHLARMWLLAGGIGQDGLARAYQVDWSHTTSNVLVDLIGVGLLAILPLRAVGSVLCWLMIVGPALGIFALARSVHGRLSLWHGLALGVVWGEAMAAGFLSFNVSLGLAAGLLALDHHYGPNWPKRLRAAAQIGALLLVYACHPYGVVFYAALDAGRLLGPSLSHPREQFRALMGPAFRVYGPAALIILAVILGNRSASPIGHGVVVFKGTWENLKSLYLPFEAYDRGIELLLKVPIALALCLGLGRGLLRIHAGLAVAAAMLVLAAMLTPEVAGNAAWLRHRFPVMAALAGCAALIPAPGRESRPLRVLLCVAILLQIGWVQMVWSGRASDPVDLNQIAPALPAGSRILAVEGPLPAAAASGQRGNWVNFHYTRRHLATLLVPLAHARIPTLFAIAGQQPLRLTPEFARQSQSSDVPHLADLAPPGRGQAARRDTARWRCTFDYLLVLEPAGTSAPPETIAGTRQIRWTRSMRLLEIVTPRPAWCFRPTGNRS